MNKTKRLLRTSFQCLFEMLVFFPLLLAIAIYIHPQLDIRVYFLYLFLLCQAGTFLRSIFDIRSRWLQLLIGMVLICIILYTHKFTLLYGAIFSITVLIAYFRGVTYMEADWEGIFPRQMWWIALIFYILAGFFYSRVITLKAYLPYIVVCGFLQVLISLTILNYRQLGDATLVRDKKPVIPSAIRRQNRILLLINIGIITIIASFNKIKEFSKVAFKQIIRWIVKIIEAIHSLIETDSIQEGAPQGMPNFPFQDDIAPKHPILELIFNIIAIILVVIGAAIVINLIYKGIKKLISIISEWLKGIFEERDLHEESYGYIDEKESLIDIKEIRDRYAEKVRDWIEKMLEREPKWRDLKSNTEKIRYIYRMSILKYLKKGYTYKSYMTPTEVERDIEKWQGEQENEILEEIVPAYNRARYGQAHIEDVEVEILYNLYRDS